MKRRIIGLALLCVMLLGIMLSAVSCGESTKISEAVDKTRGLDSISADVFIDLEIGAGYRAKQYKLTKEINSVELENGERLTKETSKTYGFDDESEVTYLDGKYAYLPSGMKQELEEYAAYNTVYTSLINDLLVKIPESALEENDNGYKLAKSEEYAGKFRVSMDFNNATASEMEMFSDMYSSLFANLVKRVKIHLDCEACQKMKAECEKCGDGALDCLICEVKRSACKSCVVKNFEFEDCYMEMEIRDGYVTKAHVKFDAYMDVGEDGSDVSVCGKIELRVNNPGHEVSVTLPKDVNKWKTFTYDRRPILKDLLK